MSIKYQTHVVQSMIKKAIIKSKLTDQTTWEYAKEESEIHKQFSNNDNVVRLYEAKETPESYDMYMEYCDKGDAFADKILEVSKFSPLDESIPFRYYLSNMADNNSFRNTRLLVTIRNSFRTQKIF